MRIINFRLLYLTLLLFSSMYSLGQAGDSVARAQSHVFDSMLLNIKSILLNIKDAKSENEKVHGLNNLVGTIEDDYFGGYDVMKPVMPNVNTALPIIDKALSITDKLTDQKEKASIKTGLIKLKCCTVHDLALTAMVKGDYTEALKFFFSGLKIAEEINYTASIIDQYLGFGDVYYDIRNYNDALKYYLIGLKKKERSRMGK